MVILAVLTLTASEYLGTAESGRSRPMRCICDDAEGQQHEVFVKGRGFWTGLHYDHLTCELVANQFACDLGLPAAKPCVVEVSQEFLALIPQDAEGVRIRTAFHNSADKAFGSVAFSQQIRRWDAANAVHKGQLIQALELYLFDTIVENSDRSRYNPKLLVSGDELKVIDFGECFERCSDVMGEGFGGKPWEDRSKFAHIQGERQHVLFSHLRGVAPEQIDQFAAKVQSVSENIINAYVSIVPEEWGQDTACRIVDYLLEARRNTEEFANRAKEVLIR